MQASANHSPEAWTAVCRAYWYPVYAYLRRRQFAHEEAEDLTQGFFQTLLEKNYLAAADPNRGRFRSFLLTSVRHYVAHEQERCRAQKRGGNAIHVPIEDGDAGARYAAESLGGLTPEQIFDRQWALSVLDSVLGTLRKEYRDAGKADEFELLAPALVADDEISRDQLAAVLGLSPGALRVAIHRMRVRFRAALRGAIAVTVSNEQEIDDEIRRLVGGLTV